MRARGNEANNAPDVADQVDIVSQFAEKKACLEKFGIVITERKTTCPLPPWLSYLLKTQLNA